MSVTIIELSFGCEGVSFIVPSMIAPAKAACSFRLEGCQLSLILQADRIVIIRGIRVRVLRFIIDDLGLG